MGMFSTDKKVIERLHKQDTWNDLFSTKLIELLDKVDGICNSVSTRMRKIEELSKAEELLLDEANNLRTAKEALSLATSVLAVAKQSTEVATAKHLEAQESNKRAETAFSNSREKLEAAIRTTQEAGNSLLLARKNQEQTLKQFQANLRLHAASLYIFCSLLIWSFWFLERNPISLLYPIAGSIILTIVTAVVLVRGNHDLQA